MAPAAGTRLGPYEILEPLGAGGMGEVYRATDTKLGRDVAIKVLPSEVAEDAERLARFEREAQLLAALNHPNVGAIYGLEEADGKPFLVLELVEGEELQERLARGPIPVDEAIDIAGQIAEGLEAAHEKGVVHRDLKPANVKLTPDGKVKVLDFGLAKAWAGDPVTGSSSDLSQSPTLAHAGTQAGVILGTAAYMSPEQARGKPVDRRTDVWAFGTVFWEMLTGRQLFSGDTVSDIVAAVLTREPDWAALPADTPRAVRRLLRRCLARSPHDRLHDIADARLEIAESLSEEGRVDEPRDAPHVIVPPLWRRVLPWGLAAVLAVACLALVRRPEPQPPLMKLEVSAPEDTVFGVEDGQVPRLSPDGRTLVFSARDTQGQTRLYVRPLDAHGARALPGTEGALYPFWSPDSRHIGFFAAGKLLKVEATGGALVDLCRAPDGRGATWSRDGIIVFSPGYHWPLHRVSDAGGESTPVTTLDGVETSHRSPRFLPDGRHFIYLVLARKEEGTGLHAIRLGSLDGSANQLLLHSPAAAEYASGHLLYLADDTLMARPFDTERRELTGTATPVAENVAWGSANANGFFSASENGVLAYWTGARVSNAHLVWYGRSGRLKNASADSAQYFQVALAPDGEHAAVSVLESNGLARLWVYDIARDLRTRFTLDPSWAIYPAWSPDGSALVFAALREGQFDLYRKAVGGASEAEPVLASPDEKFSGEVSRDGQWLSFIQRGAETGYDVWVLPLNGESSPRPLLQTRFEEGGGSFSPDGRWLAYQSDESGRLEIYVVAFPDGGRKQQISSDGGKFPVWRRTGEEIFYHALDGTLSAVEVELAGEDLVVGTRTPLFRMMPPGRNRAYSPTSDGQRFLIIEPEHAGDVAPVTLVLNWTAVLEDRANDR